MSLGQTMITLGMLTLLILSVISANRMILENSAAQMESEALEATAFIADSMFADILSHPFDCKVVIDTNSIYTSHTPWKQDTSGTLVTSASALSDTGGAHWGVKHMKLDPVSGVLGADIDDYDGYTTTVTRNNISGFIVNVSVYYVLPTAPDVRSGKQFLKKIQLTITNPTYLSKPVTYSALAAY